MQEASGGFDSISQSFREFNHLTNCVAFKLGVRDGDLDSTSSINGTSLQVGCSTAPIGGQFKRSLLRYRNAFRIRFKNSKCTYIACLIALKSARLNCQNATTDSNCSSLKQFEFPPQDMQESSKFYRIEFYSTCSI